MNTLSPISIQINNNSSKNKPIKIKKEYEIINNKDKYNLEITISNEKSLF